MRAASDPSAGNLSAELAARFAADLDPLVGTGSRLGLAVSGGPDSLALLLLAASVGPGSVEAATVDHRLRDGSAEEAAMVARLCGSLNVPHTILPIDWAGLPEANVQARAREARYAALANWAAERRLVAVATAHHIDDQAETLLLRLARGAGLSGLAGVRRRRRITAGSAVALVRPLLGWRREELRTVVETGGIAPVEDPANSDPRHDRTRVRALLATADAPDPARLAASAAHLAEAEEALQFAVARFYHEHHRREGDVTIIEPAGMPREIKRRMLLTALQRRGAPPPRGPDLMRLLAVLERGGSATLAGFKIDGGPVWRLSPAPPRNR